MTIELTKEQWVWLASTLKNAGLPDLAQVHEVQLHASETESPRIRDQRSLIADDVWY
jgi:hypothetical protein